MAQVRKRRDPGHRAHVHDRSTPALEHVWRQTGHERQRAPEVGLQDLARLVAIADDPGQALQGRAGVVDQHVHFPEPGDRLVGQAPRLAAPPEIGRQHRGRLPAGGLQLPGQGREPLLAPARQSESRTARRQLPGRLGADAPGGAGEQHVVGS